MSIRLTPDLYWVLILFLVKYCTARTVIVKVVRTGTVNLTNFINCDAWLVETHELSKPLSTEDLPSTAYKCPSSDDTVLLLVYGGFQFMSKFEESDNTKLSYGLVGENVTLVCFMEIYPGNLTMYNSLTIFDESNKELTKQMASSDTPLMPFDSYAEFYKIVSKPGNLTHRCEWNINLDYEGVKMSEMETLYSTVLVFLPVRNAQPDKTKVNTGDQVRCIAEGYPPPDQFFWQCDLFSNEEDGWEGEKDVLTFTHPKEFVCQCMASNDLAGRIFSAVWNGTIEATGEVKSKTGGKKEKSKKKKGKKEKDKKERVTVKKEAGKKDEKVDDDDDEEEEEEEDEEEKAPKTRRPVGSGATSAHDHFVDGVLLLLCSGVMVASSKILQQSVSNSPISSRKAC